MHAQNISKVAKAITGPLQWVLLVAWILVPATAGASPGETAVPVPADVEGTVTTSAIEQAATEAEFPTPENSDTASETSINTLPWNALEELTGNAEGVKPEHMSKGCGGLFGCLYQCCEAYEACVAQCGSVPSGWSCGRFNQCQGDPCGC